METRWTNYLLLMLVVGIHGGAIAAATLLWQEQPTPADTLPTISGVLIKAPPANAVQPPAAAKPPKPVVKAEPKPVIKPKPEPAPKPQNKPVTPTPAIANKPNKDAVVEKDAVTEKDAEPKKEVTDAKPEPTSIAKQTQNSAMGAPVTAPRVDARHQQNPAPSYPRLSRRRGEEGTVLLELIVLKDGTVDEVRIKQSSGYPRLDKSAVEAVQRWKYNPATRGGTPIDYEYVQPVTFSLKS